jgi:hypothetical protein
MRLQYRLDQNLSENDQENAPRITHLFLISLDFGLVTNLLSDPVKILLISDTFQMEPA